MSCNVAFFLSKGVIGSLFSLKWLIKLRVVFFTVDAVVRRSEHTLTSDIEILGGAVVGGGDLVGEGCV